MELALIYGSQYVKKRNTGYWKKKFHVVTTNSHEVDAACKKGTDFAHEKDSGVKEATPLQIANWYADKWAKAYRKQESTAKRYSSARPGSQISVQSHLTPCQML